MTELEYIKTSLEHAPTDPGPVNPDLLGWLTSEGNTICNGCAGRMLARGCHLPRNANPIWVGDEAEENTVKSMCCGCGEKENESK